MYRYLSIGCVILSLTACCNCRTSIGAEELQHLTVGQTTAEDIKAKFGVPGKTASKDAETIWTYDYHYEDRDWPTYIPILGGFVSGWDYRTQNDRFVFDAQGKLKSYSFSDGLTVPATAAKP